VTTRRAALRSTAYLLCGDWYLADDLVQDALTRVFSRWQRVAAGGHPDAYARRVLVTLYLDDRRRPKRRERLTDQLPQPTPAPSTDETFGSRLEIIAALREVPARQRAVVVLRFWMDLSVEQTAEALNISTGTVKSQTSHGLLALKDALARRGIESMDVTAGEQS
jgi:RNA polymerase sigma-70 factor (sigma-E family)